MFATLYLKLFIAICMNQTFCLNEITLEQCNLVNLSLSNGLEVVLAENQNFNFSSLAIAIDAGYFYDPIDVAGLAHFSEHMIFQGSKKYPVRDHIRSFFSMNSGEANGVTSGQYIKFYFRISDSLLHQAADLFVNALTEPLLNKDHFQGEIKAINYEFKSNLKNPFFQFCSMTRLSLHENLPDFRLSCGNRKSLDRPNLDEKLKSFMKNYFTADRMKLVISSKKSRNEMLEIAKLFEKVPKATSIVESLNILNAPIKISNRFKRKIVNYFSSVYKPCVYITIQIPTLESYLSCNRPFEYLKEAFNSRSFGSLHKILEDLGLAKNFIFSFNITKRMTTAIIAVDSTDKGLKNINEIVQTVHTYISSIVPSKKLFDVYRTKAIEKLKNNNDDLSVAFYFTNLLLCSHNLPISEFLSKYEYNERSIRELTDIIANVDNWVVLKHSKTKQLTHLDPDSLVRYDDGVKIILKTDYSKDLIKRDALIKNNLIEIERAQSENSNTENIKHGVVLNSVEKPYIKFVKHENFHNGEYTLLYDNKISENSCLISMSLAFSHDISKVCEILIFVNIMNLIFKEKFANAKIKYSSKFDENNLELSLIGPNKETINQFKLMWKEMNAYDPKASDIRRALIEIKNCLKNSVTSSPYFGLIRIMSKSIQGYPSSREILKFFNKSSCQNFLKSEPLSEYYTSIIGTGDISETEIKLIANIVKCTKPVVSIQNHSSTHQRVPLPTSNKSSTAILMGYEIKSDTEDLDNKILKEHAISCAVKAIISTPFNNRMRNENSVSYLNDVIRFQNHHKFYICFLVQSVKEVDLLEKIIKQFSSEVNEILRAVTDDEFKALKIGICESISMNFTTLQDLNYFAFLMNAFKIYDFQVLSKLVEFVKSLTKEDIYNAKIFENQPKVVYSVLVRKN